MADRISLLDLDPEELCMSMADWGDQSPTTPIPGYFSEDSEGWLNRHNGHAERATQGKIRVLLLGDSITEGWSGSEQQAIWDAEFAPLDAANFGIGGDRTQQVLWRIEKGLLDGLSPEVVVLKIGVNNLWAQRHSADEVLAGIRAIVEQIRHRLPDSRILLQGILPTGELPDNPLRTIILEINEKLPSLADGDTVRFVNFGAMFLQPDGTISAETMPDFCHLTPDAYRRWADALLPEIRSMLR